MKMQNRLKQGESDRTDIHAMPSNCDFRLGQNATASFLWNPSEGLLVFVFLGLLLRRRTNILDSEIERHFSHGSAMLSQADPYKPERSELWVTSTLLAFPKRSLDKGWKGPRLVINLSLVVASDYCSFDLSKGLGVTGIAHKHNKLLPSSLDWLVNHKPFSRTNHLLNSFIKIKTRFSEYCLTNPKELWKINLSKILLGQTPVGDSTRVINGGYPRSGRDAVRHFPYVVA